MNTLLFLGTGAADWPEEVSATANDNRNFRRRSAVLLNDQLLIDCGRTVPEAMRTFHSNLKLINDILITHSHSDHLNLSSLSYLVENRDSQQPVKFWAHPQVLEIIPKISGLMKCAIKPGQSFKADDFTITALPANHIVEDSTETALYYLFQSPNCTFLYATDGAWLLKDTWLAMKGKQLDAIIWDATIGEIKDDWRIFEHNNLAMIRIMKASLMKQDIITTKTKVVLTHLAMTLHPAHNEVEQSLSPEGLIVAYDGFKLMLD